MKVRLIRMLPDDSAEDWTQGEIVRETDEFIELTLGEDTFYQNAAGEYHIQKDYRVGGEVWQVHLTDADPFPSRPHAHCVGGRTSFVGNKLHLGTRQMFHGSKPLDLFLPKKPFARLIQLIQPKFPNMTLPIPMSAPTNR